MDLPSGPPGDVLDDVAAESRFDNPTEADHAVMALLRTLPRLTMPDSFTIDLRNHDGILTHEAAAAPSEVVDLRQRRRSWIVPFTIAAAIVILGGIIMMRPPTSTSITTVGPVLASGTDYTSERLPGWVPDLMSRSGLDTSNSSTQATRMVPVSQASLTDTFAATPDSLARCVDSFSAAQYVRVVLVDIATFQGKPVGVIVTRSANSNVLEATVVPLDCGTGVDVLAHASLPSF